MKQAIKLETSTIISTTMSAIATIVPITTQFVPFIHKPPDGSGLLVMVVEDRNGLDSVEQASLGIPRERLAVANTPSTQSWRQSEAYNLNRLLFLKYLLLKINYTSYCLESYYSVSVATL